MNIISENLPEVLRPVVEKWAKNGKHFHINSKNFNIFNGKMLQYLGMPSGIVDKPWLAASPGAPSDLPIEQWQMEDIASAFLALFTPANWCVVLDYRCNYKCPMCPFHGEGYIGEYWDTRQDQRRIVPQEEAFRIIDKLSDNGVSSVCLTSPGELFLYPHWESVSRYATDLGLSVYTISNGSLIDEAMCKRMVAAGVQRVNLSLDAVSRETYALVRSGKSEYYDIAFAAPALLKKHGVEVEVSFVRQKENHHEIEDFVNKFQSEPVDRIYISSQIEYLEKASVDKMGFKPEPFARGVCSRYGNFSISADGVVTACCEMVTLFQDQFSYDLPKINFLETPYSEIIETMNRLLTDADSPLQPICRNCALFSLPYGEMKTINGWIHHQSNRTTFMRRAPFPKEISEKMEALLEKIRDRSLLIYGSGSHTERLLFTTGLHAANLVGVADSNPGKKGFLFHGHQLLWGEEINNISFDFVLISSEEYQEEIFRFLQSKGVDEARILTLYPREPEKAGAGART